MIDINVLPERPGGMDEVTPERGYPSVLRLAPAGTLVVGMRVADEDVVLTLRYVRHSRLPR